MRKALFSINACSNYHWFVVLYTWNPSMGFSYAIQLLNEFYNVYCNFNFCFKAVLKRTFTRSSWLLPVEVAHQSIMILPAKRIYCFMKSKRTSQRIYPISAAQGIVFLASRVQILKTVRMRKNGHLNLKLQVCFLRIALFPSILHIANTIFDRRIIQKSRSRLLISLLYLKAVYTCCERESHFN